MNPPPSTAETAEATAIQSSSHDHHLRVPCFCEENAWRVVYRHLHGQDAERNISDWDNYHVVFVSNENRCCPFFRQRAKPNDPEEYVCWDYHVIVIRSKKIVDNNQPTKNTTEVLDIDTWLPYPCPLQDYLDESFPHANNPRLDPQYLPLFRVISANNYLKYFYSDRMHMKKDGKWMSPPPEYKPIMNGLVFCRGNKKGRRDGSEHNNSNLDQYIDMSGDLNNHGSDANQEEQNSATDNDLEEKMGKVFTLAQLRDKFNCI